MVPLDFASALVPALADATKVRANSIAKICVRNSFGAPGRLDGEDAPVPEIPTRASNFIVSSEKKSPFSGLPGVGEFASEFVLGGGGDLNYWSKDSSCAWIVNPPNCPEKPYNEGLKTQCIALIIGLLMSSILSLRIWVSVRPEGNSAQLGSGDFGSTEYGWRRSVRSSSASWDRTKPFPNRVPNQFTGVNPAHPICISLLSDRYNSRL